MNKKARTDLFLARLHEAPACESAEAALEQVGLVLNGVENEFTSIPFNPDTGTPQEDSRRDLLGRADIGKWSYDMDDRTGDGQRCFDALLASLDGVVSASIDAPSDPMGEWYLDLEIEGFSTSVAWKHDRGFGIFSSGTEGIGSRPDETFRDPCLASRRLLQLAEAARQNRNPRLRLCDVRHLVNERQTELADRLNVGQGVISRLENRNDAKLSTIYGYIEALGGRAVLMVKFDDFEAPIEIDFSSGASDAAARHPVAQGMVREGDLL